MNRSLILAWRLAPRKTALPKSLKQNHLSAKLVSLVAGLTLLLVPACRGVPKSAEPRRALTVMSALPLFWKEGDTSAAIGQTGQLAPIMEILAEHYRLSPVDTLTPDGLKSVRLLMLAQPRALQPSELVALDSWVRKGGKVLIFADPQLDWPSLYPLGDRRRAPPVTLLDPLFVHWGLGFQAQEAELKAKMSVQIGGTSAEVISFGRWSSSNNACQLGQGRVVAQCEIEKGRVTLVGDADLLDLNAQELDGAANAEATKAALALLEKGES